MEIQDVCSNFANEMKILITGATGFIGSFIVEEALRQGFETWAAVRKTSSRKYLCDERIRFIELDLSNSNRLAEQLHGMQFDYVVHAAGVTKCVDHDDFFRVNTQGTKNLVNAILALQMPVRKFVYLSSLSVCGAIRELQPHQDILATDLPQPNTDYGRSKLQAERYLETVADRLDYVILRPTGVYGPRETDYLMMAKSVKRHIDFAVGGEAQDITFVYVSDVVQAVFLSLTKGRHGAIYLLSDGEVYHSEAFSNLIRKELGNPWWIRITSPLWLLRCITSVGECFGRITGKVSALNKDKYFILKQRNWRCDITPARVDLGYTPGVKLQEGVCRSIRWYKENKWL